MYKFYTHPNYSYVQILSIPFSAIEKIDFALCNQPTETPDAYYARQSTKPDIITNGGFFVMASGETCFSYIDEGRVIEPSTYLGLGIRGSKDLYFSKPSGTYRDFIAAYPPLVVDGARYVIDYATELNYNRRATCVGWNKENYYIVVVGKPGLTFRVVQNIFLELGVDYAINLDGGGSSRLLINGQLKTDQAYARPVDNVMCVYLKKNTQQSTTPDKTAPTVLYRVQVGAFGVKANADKLLSELKTKSFSDAYVKKVGLLYKVQLGAFSVKLNAERLGDRLEGLGYKVFITTK